MENEKIKIAMVAPAFGEIGGPEVATKNLSEALSKRDDIELTLFCPRDWKTENINRIDTLAESLWNMKDFKKQTSRERINLMVASQLEALKYEQDFDIIHLNSQAYAYSVGKMAKKPVLLTLHSGIGKREFNQITEAKILTVSLTKAQRGRLQTTETIWNGVPTEKIKPSFSRGTYLITIGRLTAQKGIDVAIQVAKKANKKLLIFGRIGLSEERQKYYQEKIKPFLDSTQIIYMKEVSNQKILEYTRQAAALLFTIKKPEAFGMVAAEALACGTPVIGTEIGSLPEILKDNQVAFLSNNINQLVEAAKNTDRFSREKCREYAEKFFEISIMAENYANLYKKILAIKK